MFILRWPCAVEGTLSLKKQKTKTTHSSWSLSLSHILSWTKELQVKVRAKKRLSSWIDLDVCNFSLACFISCDLNCCCYWCSSLRVFQRVYSLYFYFVQHSKLNFYVRGLFFMKIQFLIFGYINIFHIKYFDWHGDSLVNLHVWFFFTLLSSHHTGCTEESTVAEG